MHTRDLHLIRPMLDFKTASTIATSIVDSKLDPLSQLGLHPNTPFAGYPKLTCTGCTKTPGHHHITPVLKSFHWLKIPERIHFKVLSLIYNSLKSSKPTYAYMYMYLREPSSQPALPDHLPVSHFLDPWSLLISCSPAEPYPSQHHVFGMTYHLNCVTFLYLHHRYFQSQDILFIRLLYPLPQGLPLKTKMSSPLNEDLMIMM